MTWLTRRVGVGLQHGLLVEVDRRTGQPPDAAVGLDDLGGAEQVERSTRTVDRDTPGLPVAIASLPLAEATLG